MTQKVPAFQGRIKRHRHCLLFVSQRVEAHVPGLRESLTCPCPTPLAAPYNHLFSYFHQQPNYWSFKVSARCFCLCDNCMSCPLLPPPLLCTCFSWGCAIARAPSSTGGGPGAAGYGCCSGGESGGVCQGLVDLEWESCHFTLGVV